MTPQDDELPTNTQAPATEPVDTAADEAEEVETKEPPKDPEFVKLNEFLVAHPELDEDDDFMYITDGEAQPNEITAAVANLNKKYNKPGSSGPSEQFTHSFGDGRKLVITATRGSKPEELSLSFEYVAN